MAKEKTNPFKTVGEQLPFYPDLESNVDHEMILCTIEGAHNLGDDPDKQIPVYKVTDITTGEQKFVIQSYAIKKAVETARKDYNTLIDVVFRFEYLGKKTVNGKAFNLFNTAYCTMEEYTASQSETQSKKSK
jgi:hypothetical protein